MTINEKLIQIQAELKAPKDKTNNFGGYKYRSCESILEAVKPLLKTRWLHADDFGQHRGNRRANLRHGKS